jgi:trans-2,3-dihydro-3-hydroxyanthranilate isomerase
MKLKGIKAKLVDVFAERKLTGNGLTIFWDYGDLSSKDIQILTQEMRQFESIFVQEGTESNRFKARIFTMEEELDFAGHPLIGLAAHLHEKYGTQERHAWKIELKSKTVRLVSHSKGDYYSAAMEQGPPEFIRVLNQSEKHEVLSALNMSNNFAADMPLEVISTGLPYLIVPLKNGLEQARIKTPKFESLLNQYGAKFVYVLDVNTFEGRTWDNEGKVEDIATGSAAGPAAAFLFKAKLVTGNKPFQISQGRMLGRPSKMEVLIKTKNNMIRDIIVSGDVHKVVSISFG